jgi:hypothetical protein
MRLIWNQWTLMAVLAVSATGTWAQSSEASCILAGRLDAEQRWAPQARNVELLDASGQRIRGSGKEQLGLVKQVRLSQPALLASCNGGQSVTAGPEKPGPKQAAPALAAGAEPITVESVNYPPLKVGGEWVELKVAVRPERVVQLKR